MPKIVLFNGPPRSGKDTATKIALEHLGKRAIHYRFAGPLKDAVHGLFGMANHGQEHFDNCKNEPNDLFFGMTPREAYIWLSEQVVKPKFGKDFFAKVAVNSLSNKAFDQKIIVVSDCGFAEEADELLKAFGLQNIALVYLTRDGCDFKGDSRSYITSVICRQYTIENNGSIYDFRENIVKMLTDFTYAK